MTSSPSESSPAHHSLLSHPHRGVWGLLLLTLFLLFFRLGSVPLFDLDEALYVTSARQMVLHGDTITPRLNSHPPGRPDEATTPFFEKPILVYWAAYASMRAFGIAEGTARLPVAFAALFTTGLIVFAGIRWFGRRAGLLAGLVYITAPLTILDARQMTTDGLLVLWFTLAMISYSHLQERPPSNTPPAPLRQWGPAIAFWTACALAILTKGAVGLLLPLLVIGVTLFINRKSKIETQKTTGATLRALRPIPGLLLLLLLAAPWHIAVWKAGARDARGATFVEEYLIRQHIGRFRGGDKVHNAPLPSYVVFFLIGFFPWACFAPAAFIHRTTILTTENTEDTETEKGEKQSEEARTNSPENNSPSLRVLRGSDLEARRFLLAWFWTIFVFFSLSAAKLPTYIAPAYPAAALLVGRWLDFALDSERAKRALVLGTTLAVLVGGLLFAAATLAPRFTPKSSPVPADVIQLAQGLTLILLLGSGFAWVCFQLRTTPHRVMLGIATLALTMTLFFTGGVTMGYTVARREVMEPYQGLAKRATSLAARGVPVVYYNIIPRRPSMLYYADYSSYERKETPLLPFLQTLPKGSEKVLVITSQKTLNTELIPELRAVGVRWNVVETTGRPNDGWVSVEVFQKPGAL